MTRTGWSAAAILLLAVAMLCACGGGDDDDAIDPEGDDDTGDDDDPAVPCGTYADCPDPEICKDGFCAEPVFPQTNEIALRRVTADDPDENLIVHGRLIRPAAHSTRLGTFPTDLALSPDGRMLAINENGFGTVWNSENPNDKRHALRIVDTDSMEVVQTVVMPGGSMFFGLRFSADGTRLYVTGGDDRAIHVYTVNTDARQVALERSIPVSDCYTSDIALSADERTLYTACNLEDEVAVVDLDSDSVVDRWDAGSRPYTLALLPDDSRLYVANWSIPSIYSKRLDDDAKSNPSRPDGGDSVTVLRTNSGRRAAKITVGLSPEGMLMTAGGETLYVVCNKTDDVFAIDTATNTVAKRISLHGDTLALKGILPTMAALSPDEKTLYLAGAGENLIAVVDTNTGALRGTIPTEWYPTDVAVSSDGSTLYVLNGKGRGDGPTESEEDEQSPVGRQLFGTVFSMRVPTTTALIDYTQTVRENNAWQDGYFDFSAGNDSALPSPPGGPSPIKYVFFILKENFSYDSAWGDFERGEGDPDYQTWPEDSIINQRLLAREFTLFDNFYCDAESSIDGHQWAAASIEPDFVEKGWVLDYAGYGFPEIAVSLTPGSVPESQFWMPHLIQQGINVRSYGGEENFGLEVLTTYRDYVDLGYPFLLDRRWLDRDRGDRFKAEFERRVAEGDGAGVLVDLPAQQPRVRLQRRRVDAGELGRRQRRGRRDGRGRDRGQPDLGRVGDLHPRRRLAARLRPRR